MAVKIGDLLPVDCTPVANVPFALLNGADGTLQLEVDSVEVGKKLPLASERVNYEEALAVRGVIVCDLRGEFAQQGHPLMIDIKALEPGNCYTIKSADDPFSALAFSAKSPIPHITRTTDGKLWAVYVLPGNFNGNLSSVIYLTWSTNKGVSWQGHLQVNTVEGDSITPALVADGNDVIHITYTQNQFGWSQDWTHTNPSVYNIHYRTYNQQSGFGSDILVTDKGFQDFRPMTQLYPTLAVDTLNRIHIVWAGPGWAPSDQYGNPNDTLNYTSSPVTTDNVTILDGTPFGESPESPSILSDPDNGIHIVYGVAGIGTEMRYQGPLVTGSYETILTRGIPANFCLIPVDYDEVIEYEPFLGVIDASVSRTPKAVFAARERGTWSITSTSGLSGDITDVTGGFNPDTQLSEGPLTVTSVGHGLVSGEFSRVNWGGLPFGHARRGWPVTVVDDNTFQLDGSDEVTNSFNTTGVWAVNVGNVSTARDAAGVIRVAFHETEIGPETYVGDTYMFTGQPEDMGEKELISEGVFWPGLVSMDRQDLGIYQIGYMFTNAYGTNGDGPPNTSFYRVCLTLEDPAT